MKVHMYSTVIIIDKVRMLAKVATPTAAVIYKHAKAIPLNHKDLKVSVLSHRLVSAAAIMLAVAMYLSETPNLHPVKQHLWHKIRTYTAIYMPLH